MNIAPQKHKLVSESHAQTAGVLWGYWVRNGEVRAITEDTLAEYFADRTGWIWLHFALSDHRACRFLDAFEAAPAEARAFIRGPERRVQFHLRADWSYGILPDIEKDFEGHTLGMGRLFFVADARHFITARHHPMRVVDEVRPGKTQTSLQGPAHVFTQLVERFIDIVEARMNELAASLDTIEDMVLAGRDIEDAELGPIRSELSRYHREFVGLRHAFARAVSHRAHGEAPFLAAEIPRLVQEAEDIDRDVSAQQDRARLLYEEMDTRINAVTNRAVRILTVFSTLLIPPTFIAGAYGMNVPGIPWANNPQGFWWAIGLCGVVVAGSYVMLRRLKILP